MKNLEYNDKKGLQNLPQYEPNPELWDQIESALDQERKPKLVFWRWTTGIAATLAMLLTINWLMKSNQFEKSAPLAKLNEQNTVPITPQKTTTDTVELELTDTESDQIQGTALVSKPPQTGVTFKNSSAINGNANGLAYQWEFGDGTNGFSDQSANVNNNSETFQLSINATSHSYTPESYSLTAPMTMNWTTSGNYSVPSTSGVVSYDLNATEFKNNNSYYTQDEYGADGDGVIDGLDNYPSSTIDVPFVRVPGKEKYQCVISDTISLDGLTRKPEPINTETYAPLIENEYKLPQNDPLSTFGIDVDNASYSIVRSKINGGEYVPKDAVRVEEFINYFPYLYPQPTDQNPFSVNMEVAQCAWNKEHQLVRIGLKGKDIDFKNLSASNLVFLIDVSGSMSDENKLPLVKQSLKLLVDQLSANDRIAIVTYAGAAGLALPSTACNEKEFIKKRIDKLESGGSTAGGEGIKLAYKEALDHLLATGNNRVILCTDGDFNVGASSDSDMKDLIIENRNKGIFITACGFGMGNYQDSKMETIADNGNGNYFYIDNFNEAEKVFERDIRATLFTIAKDVKIQVEFNPKHVKAYRLIGYENRLMPPQDFNDDTKDGGELGAGHKVTALYEIIPANSKENIPGQADLKYQKPSSQNNTEYGDELLTIKLRYKQPREDVSKLMTSTLKASNGSFKDASEDFRFAAGVALFSQQLRQSKFIETKDFTLAKNIISKSMTFDPNGEKSELLILIEKSQGIYNQTVERD